MAGLLIPEISRIAAQMSESFAGKTIAEAHLGKGKAWANATRRGWLHIKPDEFQEKLSYRKVRAVSGKGRWLFTEVEPGNHTLIFGEAVTFLRYYASHEDVPSGIEPRGKEYLSLHFDDGSLMVLRQSAWGLIRIIPKDEIPSAGWPPGQLGISPCDKVVFTYSAFSHVLEEFPEKMIRDVLIDQRQISGLNNPYLHDIFFKARVHPKRKVKELRPRERQLLHRCIIATVEKGMRLGGAEQTYDLHGVRGKYVPEVGLHMVAKPCPECGTDIIKDKLVSAPLYFCPKCQRA